MDSITENPMIDEDLKKISRIFRWYGNGIMIILNEFRETKRTTIKSREMAIKTLETMRLRVDFKTKQFFEHVNNISKQLTAPVQNEDVVATGVISKPKTNRLSLKRNETPVYTDDELSGVFTFNKEILPKVSNNNNNNDKLYVNVDNFLLTFEKHNELDKKEVNIVNEGGEIILKDNSVFKKHDDEYKVNFKCITRNEMLKIYFNDIQCFIKKSDVCKQEIVDLEQSDLNFDEDTNEQASSYNLLHESFSIKTGEGSEEVLPSSRYTEADTLLIKQESQSDITFCTELDNKAFEDFDKDTDILELSNLDIEESPCPFTQPVEENETPAETYIGMLEALSSFDELDEISDETDDEEEDSETEEDMKPKPPTVKKKNSKGRVINNNLLMMQREIHTNANYDCFIKLERYNYLEDIIKKHLKGHRDTDEEEINRLTNLNQLKRRAPSRSSSNGRIKKKKCKKLSTSSSSESESNNDNDSNNSEPMKDVEISPVEFIELCPPETLPHEEYNQDIELLELLQDVVSDKDSSEKESDASETVEASSKLNDGKESPESKKKRLYKKKSKWREDNLLNEKLDMSSSDSESSTGSGILKKRFLNQMELIEKKKTARTDQNRKSITPTKELPSTSTSDVILNVTSDEDRDNDENVKTDKELSTTKISEKENTLISDSDDNNSDLLEEYVVNIESESDSEVKGQGRRNIRALMSDDVLADATKKANKEEELRKQRLLEKGKQVETFTQSLTSNSQDDILVLDVDENYQPLVSVHAKLVTRLKPHQKEGVKFMWNVCFESLKHIKEDEGCGCILAHCMGLGKTFQVVTLIHTLFSHATGTKYVLVICPLSTVLNWKNEFRIGLDNVRNNINIFTICDQTRSKKQRLFLVDKWYRETGVLIMGYQAYVSLVQSTENVNKDRLQKALINPGPDLVVCDEGHLLKNSKTHNFQKISTINTKRRIVLTGTPMQNNLKEYYHMVQFVKPNLLGSYKEFTNRFINPITNGQFHDSNMHDIHIMKKRSHVLHKLLESTIQRYEASELQMYLPRKNDYVLFIRLSDLQVKLYERYGSLINEGTNVKNDTLFRHYHNLQMVWNHPLLLDLKAKQDASKKPKEIDTINLDPEIPDIQGASFPKDWWKDLCPNDLACILEYGSKFVVVRSILELCQAKNDKVLIFSSSIIELDALEIFLTKYGTNNLPWTKNIDYLRLDGTVAPDTRIILCNKFNNRKSTVKAFLISHRVGGLGLNLTAANRTILLDVCWNPSYDSQAIFRMYRFGQTKECFVYRLVSMGTLEETIYVRSINKLAISGRVVDERQISRHFKMQELQFLYRLDDDLRESRPIPKVPQDKLLAILLKNHQNEIFKYHEHQSLLENMPNEKLDEEEMKLAWEEFHKENEVQVEQSKEMNRETNEGNAGIMDNLKNLNARIINELKNPFFSRRNNEVPLQTLPNPVFQTSNQPEIITLNEEPCDNILIPNILNNEEDPLNTTTEIIDINEETGEIPHRVAWRNQRRESSGANNTSDMSSSIGSKSAPHIRPMNDSSHRQSPRILEKILRQRNERHFIEEPLDRLQENEVIVIED